MSYRPQKALQFSMKRLACHLATVYQLHLEKEGMGMMEAILSRKMS